MKYVDPSDLVIGKKYRLVDVERHPFCPSINLSSPFEYRGIDPSDGYHEIYFADLERVQWFDGSYVTDKGFFKIVAVEPKPLDKLSPQCRQIIEHLQKGHTITQRSALMDFGIMALPRRIADLKEAGYQIESVIENNKLTGQRYARYSLADTKKRAA